MQFQPVLRGLGRPVAQGRGRRRGRLRQLLGRARHHPPRRCRPGRRELEQRRLQGDPVRLGRDHRRPRGQPQGHQGLGRPAPARASRSSRPNPFSSGSAKWNLLAPYAAKSDGGKNPQAGLDYINTLVSEHVKIQPKSGREATETFLQGTGDVLLSYENEALFIERNGDPVEHVTPPTTFKIENPVAVISEQQEPRDRRTPSMTTSTRRRPRSCGPRPVSVRSIRLSRRSSRLDFPQPQQAVDDRGPRWLVRRRRGTLQAGDGQYRRHLRERDEVGTARVPCCR